MRNTTAHALFLTLLAALAPACDAHEGTADRPAADFRILPGGYWSDGDDGCGGKYLKTESGAMCVPPCGDEACNAMQVDACGHPRGYGPTCLSDGFCTFMCWSDSHCIEGQRCDAETGQCVWQNEPTPVLTSISPGPWGTCVIGDGFCPAEQCHVGQAGSLCSPSCASDDDCAYGPANECGENLPATCSAGMCKVHCDDFGGCWGVNGMGCDPDVNQCVWQG